ncbi:MAG TPA: hypothetical protein VGQ76_11385 [Thermoanaerobaculia bacterium]|nr:hypothetical protein [Thermoanaerobaculia bacterium]
MEFGLTSTDLLCTERILIGEPPHIGMPHMFTEPETIERVALRIRKELPGVHLVTTPEEADFVISVITFPKHACTHCEPEPDTGWSGTVERGGPTHRSSYEGMGSYLLLSGEVLVGTMHPGRAFVNQLRALIVCDPTAGQSSSFGSSADPAPPPP